MSVEMANETCCNCGIVFSMTAGRMAELRHNGKDFYCPNGHAQYYTDSDSKKIKKLKKQLADMTSNRDYWRRRHRDANASLDHERRRYNGLLGYVAKLKRKLGIHPDQRGETA